MISGISTASLFGALRSPIQQIQQQLASVTKEAASGRQADAGLFLGAQTSQSTALYQQQSQLQNITQNNNVVSTQLSATQAALGTILTAAQSFQSQLLAVGNGAVDPSVIQSQAQSGLQDLTSTLNTSSNSQYIFGGTNSGVKPMSGYYQTPASAAQNAVASAFSTAFGTSQSAPAASAITPANMQTFLSSGFSALFSSPQWNSAWSSASDKPTSSRITPSETIQTSVTANEPAIQGVAKAYTMIADLGLSSLSSGTRQTVIAQATATIGQAISDLTDVQARVGTMQNQVTTANTTLSSQSAYVSTQIGKLENVDPAQASSEISTLTTQLETAYSLTSQISKLSLVNYL